VEARDNLEIKRNIIFVYIIKNKINNKRYIGITTRSPKERLWEHFGVIKKEQYDQVLYRAIRKYGKENFYLEWSGDYSNQIQTIEELKDLEIQFIEYYKTYVGLNPSYGYNMTLGGDGFPSNMSKVKQYVLETFQYIKTYNSLSDAAKENNLSVGNIHACCTQTNIHCGGYIWVYEEDELDFSFIKKHYVKQYHLNGQFIDEFSTAVEAEKQLGINAHQIINCCLGKSITAGNFLWSRYNDNPNIPRHDQIINKQVEQYDLSGKFIQIFDKISDVMKYLDIKDGSNIRKVCRGKVKTSNGYIWRYTV